MVTDLLKDPIEEKPKEKKFACQLGCSEAFSNVISQRNHHANFHAKAFKEQTEAGGGGGRVNFPSKDKEPVKREERVSTDTSPTTVADVNMGAVSELTRKFAHALQDTAPDMAKGKMRLIILGFDQASYSMGHDASRMTSFLTTCGLSAPQTEFIKMVMLGTDPGQSPNGNPWGMPNNGGPTAMTWDNRTGQMVPTPIFMLGGNNGAAAPPGYGGPPTIYMPPGYGAAQPPGDGLTRRDLDDAIDRLAEKIKPAEPTAVAGPPMRRIQKVLTDVQGNAMTDAAGNYLTGWVEEPISAVNDTLVMLREIGAIGAKDPPPPLSAGEIAEAVQGAVAQLVPENTGPSPEMVEMREELRESRREFGDYMHRTELKDAETRAADEAVSKTMSTVQPLLDELKEMRSKTGLSDQQYELAHQEKIQGNILATLQTGMLGIRQDLQPLAMQSMVASMKGLGVEDNVIGDILQRMTVAPTGASTQAVDDRRAQTMRDWAK